MQINWDHIDKAMWDKALAAGSAPLTQNWVYGAAMGQLGSDVIRAQIMDGQTPIALAQFTSRRIGGIMHWALCQRGPVWLEDVDFITKKHAYKALGKSFPRRGLRFILFSPDAVDTHQTLRKAGLKRIMTGYSTILLDLRQSLEEIRESFHGKWRNRLAKAEKSGLKIIANGNKLAQYRWLLETENNQRASKHYQAIPVSLAPHYQSETGDKHSVKIWRADLEREALGAMMFLIHGQGATYHIGWSSQEGRGSNAHNLILWHAIGQLKSQGVEWLDMGGVNTDRSANLARFKLGTGGRLVSLAGTYI